MTDQPRQYTLQLRYDGGVYAPGLKQIEPRQTQAIDIRALRDQQVPDERGHKLPPDVSSGQVNWSMRGAQNQVLIGRSEQADIERGASSNYACMNCCPDSFAGGWLDPGSVSGYIGELNQFAAIEQTRNCYGSYGAPYYIYPSWDSTDWDVASLDGYGAANNLGIGEAYAQGAWVAYEWGSFESGNPDECYPRERTVLANALLSVLFGEVDFKKVTFSDKSADFNTFNYSATLDIGSAAGGSAACAGGGVSGEFTILIDFVMPPGADAIKHPDTRTFVSDADNQQFQYLNFGFQDLNFSTGRGQMWIRLRRARRTAASNRVGFTITGTYAQQTGVWRGNGRVSLVCPS